MRRSVVAYGQLQQTIDSEIADRKHSHQAAVAALKLRLEQPKVDLGAQPAVPLVLLAHGDSWFDYPLNGNTPSLTSTDIVAQLSGLGVPAPLILNLSHWGDATTDELAWPKQQRLIDALNDRSNWLSKGKPDAILFSGGGNDVVGDKFCIFLNAADSGKSGLDAERFADALQAVKASYEALFLFRDRYATGVPIVGHCYDFAIPNGSKPPCTGPWLLPSLSFAGWNTATGTPIVRAALVAFQQMLAGLANDPANNFTLIDTQNTLTAQDWANELHPYPNGFQKLAQRFAQALKLAQPQPSPV